LTFSLGRKLTLENEVPDPTILYNSILGKLRQSDSLFGNLARTEVIERKIKFSEI
jgi:hypothetical protein